ncbi:MAG: hypothetical protein WC027_00780 [Candidatus Paceibacterota bacterium]
MKARLKNSVLILLIISLVFPSAFLSFPQKTEAQFAVNVALVTDPTLLLTMSVLIEQLLLISGTLTGVLPGEAQKESLWDKIAYAAGRILVRQLTQSIVNWINTGFEGNPSFVQDPAGFMLGVGDRTIGEFIFNNPDLAFLCDPFEINVKIALGLQYSPFKDKINCTLSEVLANSENAYNDFVNGDFINGGGWDSWLSITTNPQNNQIGAMLIAQGELDAQIEGNKENKKDELAWSGGLLSWKDCTTRTVDANGNNVGSPPITSTGDPYYGKVNYTASSTDARADSYTQMGPSQPSANGQQTYTKTDCLTQTPGTVIADQMQDITGWDVERLGIADEFNEIVGALANFLVTKVLEKGFGGVNSEELSPDDPEWRAGIASLQAQQYSDIDSYEGSGDIKDFRTYEPSTVAYTNPGRTETFDQMKVTIQGTIQALLVPEQTYFASYNNINTVAVSTENDFLEVISCYQNKISSSTPPLTNSELSAANNEISVASTSASQMAQVQAGIASNLLSGQTNVTTLTNLSDRTNNASTVGTLDTIQAELNTLTTPPLHTTDQVDTAMNVASTTVTQIMNVEAPKATRMLEECQLFP